MMDLKLCHEKIKIMDYWNSLSNALNILSKSSLVRFDPEGRHNPFLNNHSEVPLTKEIASENTGCRCIGFHRGRDSILSSSRANRIVSRDIPLLN